MIWFYIALILSIAANIGFTIYIAANHLLDKLMEKNDEPGNVTGISMHKRAPVVHRLPSQQTNGD